MTIDHNALKDILATAAKEGRFQLMEHEVYSFLEAAGCKTPRHVLLLKGSAIAETSAACSWSKRVVIKIVSPEIAHKTDVGGVVKCEANAAAINLAVTKMLSEVPVNYARSIEGHPSHAPSPYKNLSGKQLEQRIEKDILGVMIVEMIQCEGEGPGSEVIFGLRHNREFGQVLTMGLGGVDTELLGEACKKGLSVVSGSASLGSQAELLELFKPTLAYKRLAGLTRTKNKLVEDQAILDVIAAFKAIALAFDADDQTPSEAFTLTELEVNPFGVSNGKLIPLDGLLKFRKAAELPMARPIDSLGPMMGPKSIGLIGVSAKGMNMGRIILRNMLEAGFDSSRAYVVRPDTDAVDGVKCVPRIQDLPERVDVFVLAVGADQVPEVMEELCDHDKAVGVILIAGGMGEKEGGESGEIRVKTALKKARREGKPIVVNGGNCLGIVSRPGKYHTLFIPQSKLPLRSDGRSNVAFISQSGAYMISRLSKLDWMSPRYAVSTGNQIDLTVTDFLLQLATDPEVHTFAVYTEGFKDADGLAFARAVQKVTASGRDVVFYKAGRTTEGKTATSGHTASLAGDYDVCEGIIREAGAFVANGFSEYLDLVKVSSLMGQKKWNGRALAAMSNAGYEAVGIADAVRGEGWDLTLAKLAPSTRERLQAALVKGKLDTLVDVRNPLDITPMANDVVNEDAVRALLEDPGVDMVLCASVPLTPVMATLAAGVPEEMSIRSENSLVNRLARVRVDTTKPLVACIDSGVLYDPMARMLEDKGIPCFRSADEAVRTMGKYLEGRLRNARQ